MTPDFEEWPEIKRLSKAAMFITQKIHGTNAQIYIFQKDDGTLDLLCGQRSGWCTGGHFGFPEMVYANKQEFIDKLGPGRHHGEWAGPGINSGEGLSKKTFVLFEHWKYPPERPLPPNTVCVPVLYAGGFDLGKVQECMNDLKTNGSKLVPGFMHTEGCVVNFHGHRYKVVFEAEETGWTGKSKTPKEKDDSQARALEKYGHLLQPVRLEKLLSRDEKYMKEYPKSMKMIVEDYFVDLVKEDQLPGASDQEVKIIKGTLGGLIFKFVKEIAEKVQVGG